ncbi:MAG TPA: hypothetical protein VF234_08130 [Limnochordia bacterium]
MNGGALPIGAPERDRLFESAFRDALFETVAWPGLLIAGALSGAVLAFVFPFILFVGGCFFALPTQTASASASCAANLPPLAGWWRSAWPYAFAECGALHALLARLPSARARPHIALWPGAGLRISRQTLAAWAFALAAGAVAAWRWPGAHLLTSGLPLLALLAAFTGWLWQAGTARWLLWGPLPPWEVLTAALTRHWLERRFEAAEPCRAAVDPSSHELTVHFPIDAREAERAADALLFRLPGIERVTFWHRDGGFVADPALGGARFQPLGEAGAARSSPWHPTDLARRDVAALRAARGWSGSSPSPPRGDAPRGAGTAWAWTGLAVVVLAIFGVSWYLYALGALRPLTAADLRLFFFGGP